MTLREWLKRGEVLLLSGPHPERARRDAESLLLHLAGKDRVWLISQAADNFGGCDAIRYAALLDRRRAGEPIQYITGEAEFYGLSFRVTPDVLIPRPETEHLVEKTIALATSLGAPSFPRTLRKGWDSKDLTQAPISGAPALDSETWDTLRIVDVGTGSGAIAVALAKHLPQAEVTAVDLSPAALSIARGNSASNGVPIRFLEGNLLNPVLHERFDVVVSNPPYVPESDRATLSIEVRDHEPALALFAGEDGLDLYRRLIPQAASVLFPGGSLVLEIGFGQSDSVRQLLASSGFQNIEFTPDLQGIPRVASAQQPTPPA